MKYYAVIDTNVIVSSVLKKNSLPGEIIDFVINGEIIPLLNQEILSEYQEVLSRKEFGFSEADVTELIKLIKSKAIYLQRLKSEEPFKDPRRRRILRNRPVCASVYPSLFDYRQ
ncbi:putative toxin-antitoxin system toxin component, PIN family [bacterium]|nr:putative toxin-antitoxin system toxin component, PIN family [bacterium]